jgi:hypothetical protein
LLGPPCCCEQRLPVVEGHDLVIAAVNDQN